MKHMPTDSDLWRRLPEPIRISVLNAIDDVIADLGEAKPGERAMDIEFRKDTRTGLSIAAGALIELASGRTRTTKGFAVIRDREGSG